MVSQAPNPLEPAAQRLYRSIPPRRIRAGCLVVFCLFALDCVLSALYRTPITY